MGVTIISPLPRYAKKITSEKFEPAMQEISHYLVSSAQRKINSGITPANSPLTQAVKKGNKTLRDNGILISSIAPHNGQSWAAAATNLKYAKILQIGGTIKSRGKGLWIPAGAKTRELMRRYNAQSPGELISAMRGDGYSFFYTPLSKVFCAVKGRQGKPFMLFLIKSSVKIPARPFLYIDDRDEQYIARKIRKTVQDTLKQE